MSNLPEQLLQLQFTRIQLESLVKEAKKSERKQRIRLKKCYLQGDIEVAKIYAEDVIRNVNEARDYIRMISVIDAVCAKVRASIAVNKFMQSAVCSAPAATTSLAQVESVMTQIAEEVRQDSIEQSGAAQSVPSGSISHAEEGSLSHSDVQSSPELVMNSVMASIRHMTPQQRTEFLNSICALGAQIGMDSRIE